MANTAVVPGLFTIVLTVFERELLLPYALQSLAWQTYPQLEILVYTDGPSPRTRGIIQSVVTRHLPMADKIQYVESLRAPGYWGNHLREQGLKDAKGEFISFLSHDTVYHPDFCRTHATELARQPCISVSVVDYWFVAAKGNDPEYLGRQPTRTPAMAQFAEIDAHCLAYPTDCLRRYASFDGILENHAADFYIFDQVRKHLPIVFHEEAGPLAAHI